MGKSFFSFFLTTRNITGNKKMLQAYKTKQYHIIEDHIIKRNYGKCPYNYALLNKEYDYLSFLLENYSGTLELNVDKDFVMGCNDIRILKTFKKKYPAVIEMLELFHIRSSFLKENYSGCSITLTSSLVLNFLCFLMFFVLYKIFFTQDEED